MKITPTQYAKSLYAATMGKPQKEIDGLLLNFVKILAKNKQLKLADKISEKFGEIWNKKNGIIVAEVTAMFEMGEGEIKKIKDYIKNKYKAQKVVLKNTVDKKIKGGIIIKVGDEILDGSIANQLRNLKNNLYK